MHPRFIALRSIFSIGAHWTYEPCPLGQQCQLSFQVPPEGMVAPVFVFYQLSEVYQNYLRYTTSKNDAQLSGQADVVPDPNRDCKTDYVSVSTANNETKSYLPCGLQAHSLFNDSYALDSTLAFISDTGIAWDTDLRTKFHNPPEFPELCDNGTTICLSSEYPTVFAAGNDGVRNEHFVVWMRLAALPTFRKLYGRIDTDIPGGVNLTINVTSHFPVDSFGGSKALILSTASWTVGTTACEWESVCTVVGERERERINARNEMEMLCMSACVLGRPQLVSGNSFHSVGGSVLGSRAADYFQRIFFSSSAWYVACLNEQEVLVTHQFVFVM